MDLKISYLSLFIFFILTSIVGYNFQNKPGRQGGPIAPSKTIWLNYTLFTWFFSPLLFLYFQTPTSILLPIKFLAISMWIRGIIELYLLFYIKKWKPIYGIIHDLFTFFGILLIIDWNILAWHELIYFISILISLLFETYFAYFFSKYIGKKTQGDNAIWFASKEDPLFRYILRITTVANCICLLGIFIFIQGLFRN